MKKLLAVMALLSFPLMSEAQEISGNNLVPNGSFEEVSKKPKKLGKIESAVDWVSPTGVRADLFVDTKIEDISVPLNARGSETARDGDNYAGIFTYSYGKKVPRSYVSAKLNSSLKKNLKYCVEFYVSLSECSKYAANNIAAKHSNKAYGSNDKVSIFETNPSVMAFDNKPITARYNWVKICGIYKAKGGEKYITLGNFLTEDKTDFTRMKKDKESDVDVDIEAAAYYYIDDVSVRLIDEDKGEKCDCGFDEELVEYSSTVYERAVNLNEEMTPKEKIEAHQLYFAFGKTTISSEGAKDLDFIAEELKANPGMTLQINGHCNESEDEVGLENDYYAKMDNKRIGEIMKYLIDKGIGEDRMTSSPQGSSAPNEDVTEADDEDLKMAKNRRVTFRIR
jgi:outer membrane protein OmpA-like peptidoglycan-associated protein